MRIDDVVIVTTQARALKINSNIIDAVHLAENGAFRQRHDQNGELFQAYMNLLESAYARLKAEIKAAQCN